MRHTAYNGRFCEMAAVTPQTILYKFERYYPAGTLEEAATSQSRWDVVRQQRTAWWSIHTKPLSYYTM